MPDVPDLDPRIHQRTRLRIMAMLYRNRRTRATWLRDRLGLTDGNLASHAGRLEAAGLLRIGRALTPQGFQLEYRITPEGDDAFRAYLERLRAVVGLADEAGPDRLTGDRTDEKDAAPT